MSGWIAFIVINKYGNCAVGHISIVFGPSYMCLPELSPEREFFGVRNFGNTSARTVIFFWKCSKFDLAFKNAETNWEYNFCFRDYCIWIGRFKLSLLRREYLWSAVNMLTNILKSLHYTKRPFFQLNGLYSDQ